jgi:formylglycine-generating enzyme required for sulfatase activity
MSDEGRRTISTRHVFISYAREDQIYARKLADSLGQHGLETWMDDRIDFGDRWLLTIVQAIQDSAAFVVVMTPEAEGSEWVERELLLAQREGKPIFPLLLRGQEFPLLITVQYANVTSGQVPPEEFYERLGRVVSKERLAAQNAERITVEKPEVEPLAPEPAEPIVRKKPAEQAWNWERLRWPFAAVVLLALVIGLVVIRPGGDGKPTPTLTTSAPVVAAPPRTETPTVTVTPTTRPKPTATPKPPTATVTPRPPTPTPTALQPPPSASLHDTWNRPADGMEMVYVPGGTFQMGSTEGGADEQPVHSVTLDSFWIDQTEVTNAQYARCVAEGICSPPARPSSATRDSYYGDSQYDDYPVMWVSWDDATTYCQWAGGRLPTEAEWEYAARGPDGHLYPWGNDPPDENLANYGYSVRETTKVGSYPGGQSWVGAMDMAGNVFEWVKDWYGRYPSEPQVNPTGPASGKYRVLRGGSWNLIEEYVRAAYRYYHVPAMSLVVIGFRCVGEPGG